MHDLVPFGEGGGVIAESLADDGVEFVDGAQALRNQSRDVRVYFLVGAGRVLPVGPLAFFGVGGDSLEKFVLFHPAALRSCFKFLVKIRGVSVPALRFRSKRPEIREIYSGLRAFFLEGRENFSKLRAFFSTVRAFFSKVREIFLKLRAFFSTVREIFSVLREKSSAFREKSLKCGAFFSDDPPEGPEIRGNWRLSGL